MNLIFKGSALAEVVRLLPLAKEDWVQSQISPCGICGGESVNRSGVSKRTLVIPCRYINSQQHLVLILIYLLFLSEVQLGETWEHSKSVRKSGSIDHNSILFFDYH
jgi:hypothetical protein